MENCPCCSDKPYKDCCKPFLESKELASDPLSLMRSRYTAFYKGKYDYIRETWHPETLPDDLGEAEPNIWIGLEIIDWGMDEEEIEGEVEFKAKLILKDQLETLHELSSFDKIEGK